jgi:hypothetical protein
MDATRVACVSFDVVTGHGRFISVHHREVCMVKAAVADASLSLAWGAGLFAGGYIAQLASGVLWGPHPEIPMI